MRTPPTLPLLCAAGLLAAGCDFRRMAIEQTVEIMRDAMPAFDREWDVELAAASFAPTIAQLEAMAELAPDYKDLLLLTSQTYAGYATFLEDRWEQEREESEAALALETRVREMYGRAHRFGLRLLERRRPGFARAFVAGREELDRALGRCARADVPALFFTAMPLVAALTTKLDDVELLAQLPKAQAMIKRVIALDETYFHASAHLVYGAALGSVPKFLGGDPARGEQHFRRALELTRRRYLSIQVTYAQTVAVARQDRALFQRLLDEVLRADLSIFAEQKLMNVLAKRRARRLLARRDLF